MISLPLFSSRTGTHSSGVLYIGLSRLQRVCLAIKLTPCALIGTQGKQKPQIMQLDVCLSCLCCCVCYVPEPTGCKGLKTTKFTSCK